MAIDLVSGQGVRTVVPRFNREVAGSSPAILADEHLTLRGEIGMKHYEYKVHYLKFETGKSNEVQLLEVLNGFGAEGWRLVRMYNEVSLRAITSWKGGANLLLEKTRDSASD